MKENILKIMSSTIKDLSKIYQKMGYDVEYINFREEEYLSLKNSKNELIYLVYLHEGINKLNKEDLRKIYMTMNEDVSKENIYLNYIIISISGYDDSESNDIYNIQKLNVKLEDKKYLETLNSMYKANTLDEYIDLFAHNKVAYDEIEKSFSKGIKKACITHATGTGKSLIITKSINDFKGENILVLSSTNYILDYLKESFSISGDNVTTMTYKKLASIVMNGSTEIEKFNPKLIIFDEFHRCGASQWFIGAKYLLDKFKDSYKLGLSATPVRYLDDCRDMSKELFEGNIVSSISLYDAIVRSILPTPRYVVALYDFEDEINNVEAKLNKSTNSNLEKSKLKKKLDVLKDINESADYITNVIAKYITTERNFVVFCKDFIHMKEMQEVVPNWFKSVLKDTDINIYELYSSNGNSSKELARYLNNISKNKDSINLLFTIDMLNEGVHAKNIDGVILLRPTTSPTIYYQQIGRALHVSSEASPLIFDFVNNSETIQSSTFIESLKKSAKKLTDYCGEDYDDNIDFVLKNIHDETTDILSMFKEIESSLNMPWDDMYIKLYDYFKINNHCMITKSEDAVLYNWLSGNIKMYSNGSLSKDKIEKLESLGIIWYRLDAKWKSNLIKLKEFKKIYNHAEVFKEYDSSLYNWFRAQKDKYSKGELDIEKQKLLEEVGVIWNNADYAWNSNYSEILDIKNSVGHLNLSKIKSYTNSKGVVVEVSKDLKKWFRVQKTLYRNNKVRDDRKIKLEALGFEELQTLKSKKENEFELNIDKLIKYKEKYQTMNVASDFDDKELIEWIIEIRSAYTKGTLSQERITKLNEIDFIWDINEYIWDEALKVLIKALKENNNDYFALTRPEYKKILSWVKNQRTAFNKGTLPQNRVDKLNAIGFVWSMKDYEWDLAYKRLENYVEVNGKGVMPSARKEPQIRPWLNNQLKKKDNGTLDEDKVEKLLILGY